MPRPHATDTPPLLEWYASLSDFARVRLLRLLHREELSVGELARAIQLPQSTVSRHLKALHDLGWIQKRSVGTASLYRMDAGALDRAARELWRLTESRLARSPTLEEDDRRLQQVIAERQVDSRAFFGRLGGDWDQLRRELFGKRFTAEALLGFLPDHWRVADLGCGTGDVAERLAPLVQEVVAVDREPAMLNAAKKRLASFDNVRFHQADLDDLPLADDSLDAAVISLVLHHAPDPLHPLTEVRRTLHDRGQLLIIDMMQHEREDYRQTMGHEHLGFSERTVAGWADALRMRLARYQPVQPETQGKGPGIFAALLQRMR